MITFYTFIIVSLCFAIFFVSRWIWHLNRARQKGVLPSLDDATMFDVRELIIKGELDLASELYKQLFKVSRFEADKQVMLLAKTIEDKYNKSE